MERARAQPTGAGGYIASRRVSHACWPARHASPCCRPWLRVVSAMVATMHNVGASSTYCVHCRGSRRQCLSDHWQSRPTRCQRLHPAQQDAERCSGSWETPAPHRPALGCVRVESALLTPGVVQVADGCRVTDCGCVELPPTRDPSTACLCTSRASAAPLSHRPGCREGGRGARDRTPPESVRRGQMPQTLPAQRMHPGSEGRWTV